jgi:hypothetical protein
MGSPRFFVHGLHVATWAGGEKPVHGLDKLQEVSILMSMMMRPMMEGRMVEQGGSKSASSADSESLAKSAASGKEDRRA